MTFFINKPMLNAELPKLGLGICKIVGESTSRL